MSGSSPPTGPAGAAAGGPVGPARIELASPIAGLELTVVASDFRPVAQGVGRLAADVPAGIYQVVARAGPVVERHLVRLAPGEVHQEPWIQVAFPSAAPVSGTTTTHEYHQEMAREASKIRRSDDPAADAGLMIMVRDVRGQAGPPLDPVELEAIALLDARLQLVAGLAGSWITEPHNGSAAWNSRLRAGGYVLRTLARPAIPGAPRPPARETLDQSLWLSPGWQTMVFATTGPTGLDLARASIHMTDLGAGWEPQEQDVGLALELALWSLREGRSVVPADLLRLLLEAKFRNPMLGILGAHALLLEPDVRQSVLAEVLANLDQLVPHHPDLVALHHLAAEARQQRLGAGAATPPVPGWGVEWPPMLLASFRGLVRADARDPGVIVDGSLADLAAAELLVQDVWTSWRPVPAPAIRRPLDGLAAGGAEAVGAPRELPAPSPSAPRGPILAPVPAPSGASGAGVLVALAARPSQLTGVRFADPAAARVARYLSAVADLAEPGELPERLASLSPQEIGLATGLPSGGVDRALATIGATLPPVVPPSGEPPADGSAGTREAGSEPPERGPRPDEAGRGRPGAGGGGGGGGLLSAPVALGLALVVLVIVGLAGAVALGAFGQRGTSPSPSTGEPTAAPTEGPTDRPTEAPTTAAPGLEPVLEAPEAVEFDLIPVGQEVEQRIPLGNSGPVRLTIVGLAIGGDAADDFLLTGDTCRAGPIDPGATCGLAIVFRPQAGGDRTASLEIATGEVGLRRVVLHGSGQAVPAEPPVVLTFDPSEVVFPGEVLVGSSSEPLRLTMVAVEGTAPITIDVVSVGEGADEFTVDALECIGRTLAAGDGCSVVLTFTPADQGLRGGDLVVSTTAVPYHVPLSGYGYIIGARPGAGPGTIAASAP